MKFATACSGIGAPEKAFEEIGWEAQWCSEIEQFPSGVLKERFPNSLNLGDMTKLNDREEFHARAIDAFIAGTPCQSFSLAGSRKGLADPRGQLALEFVRILETKKPKWFIWENVPGVFSSWTDETNSDEEKNTGEEWRTDQTSDFDQFIAAIVNVGYGVCWRVLDAQFFGVPQRRRRVFVVGYLGDWQPPFQVLSECESLSWYLETRGGERKGIAKDFEGSTYFSKQAIGEYKRGG